MPNQWAKIVNSIEPTNNGTLVALEMGPPKKRTVKDGFTGALFAVRSYVLHPKSPHGPVGPLHDPGERIGIDASRVELLGPDECARLDKLHGLTCETETTKENER